VSDTTSIGTWIGVAATAVSAVVTIATAYLRSRTKEKLAAIQQGGTAAERVVADAVTSFRLNTAKLSSKQVFALAKAEIAARDRRHSRNLRISLGLVAIAAITTVILAIVVQQRAPAGPDPRARGSGPIGADTVAATDSASAPEPARTKASATNVVPPAFNGLAFCDSVLAVAGTVDDRFAGYLGAMTGHGPAFSEVYEAARLPGADDCGVQNFLTSGAAVYMCHFLLNTTDAGAAAAKYEMLDDVLSRCVVNAAPLTNREPAPILNDPRELRVKLWRLPVPGDSSDKARLQFRLSELRLTDADSAGYPRYTVLLGVSADPPANAEN